MDGTKNACVGHRPGDAKPVMATPLDGPTTSENAAPTRELPLAKTFIGGYRLLRPLGHGGMGIVYAAEDVLIGRPAAVKLMWPRLAADPEYRERFLREVRATASLAHEHVAAVYRAAEEDGHLYLAMQLLSGETLEAKLAREGALTVTETLRVAEEAASGMAAAHRLGLVHRDIKPANLWVESRGGRIKLLDFGLARSDVWAALTLPGAVYGTPHFMAPEQAKGGKVDHRADQFSLGVVIYRVIGGELPFVGDGESKLSILWSIASETPKPLKEVNPAAPPNLCALVDRLLSKLPGERFESTSQLVEEIRSIRRGAFVG